MCGETLPVGKMVTGIYFRNVEKRTNAGIVEVREDMALCPECDSKFNGKKSEKKPKKKESFDPFNFKSTL